MEAPENLGALLSVVEGVAHRHEGECGRPGRKPECIIPDRAYGEFVKTVGRETVSHFHIDVLNGEFHRVKIIQLVVRNEGFSERGVDVYAGSGNQSGSGSRKSVSE